MNGGGDREKEDRELEEPYARAHPVDVKGLEFLLQLVRKAQIRKIPPQLCGVGRVREVIQIERGGHLHWE